MKAEDKNPFLAGNLLRFIFEHAVNSYIIENNLFNLRRKFGEGVCLIGDGPICASEMKSLFRKVGLYRIEVCSIGRDTKNVIFGIDAIDAYRDDIRMLFENRKGLELKVFTQEMILIDIFFGIEPASYANKIDISDYHATMEWLTESWPDFLTNCRVPYNINVPSGLYDWESEGPMGAAGYHVGRSSNLTKADRREILKNFFLNDLPKGFEHSIMDWGIKGSNVRAIKMAEHINALDRRTRNHYYDYSVAQKHWREDIEFIREKLYFGYVKGKESEWPRIQIGVY